MEENNFQTIGDYKRKNKCSLMSTSNPIISSPGITTAEHLNTDACVHTCAHTHTHTHTHTQVEI
jgi:hypothetical protein